MTTELSNCASPPAKPGVFQDKNCHPGGMAILVGADAAYGIDTQLREHRESSVLNTRMSITRNRGGAARKIVPG